MLASDQDKIRAKLELAKRDLFEFFKQSWRVLEPQTELQLNWHMELLCEYLVAVQKGDIKYLLINIAPRSLKSRIVSVAFPCWEWLHAPHLHYLCMSYSSSLANDHNDDRRSLIRSPWYQALSGGMKLSNSKNRITEFKNNHLGQMVARGLEASVTGSGGMRLVFDDPNQPDTVESELVRTSTLKKFKDYSIGRRNDPKKAAVIVVQQRTHVDDVSGYILKDLPEYTHLSLPTEAEKHEQIIFPISGRIVTRSPGELLHPERFDADEVERAKKTLGSYLYAGRHQQRPVPLEGGMIQLRWFNRFSTPPLNYNRCIQSWDCAASASSLSSYWVCTTWLEFEHNYYLVDMLRKQMLYPEGKRMLISLAEQYSPTAILIEKKSTGEALIPELRYYPDFSYSIISIEPERDKITRMSIETPVIEGGRIWLPQSAPWLVDFETEVGTFPLSGTMDICDSLSQALKYFREQATEHWLSVYRMS